MTLRLEDTVRGTGGLHLVDDTYATSLLNRIYGSMARSRLSGPMFGRPPLTSASYIRENNASVSAGASLTITWMRRSG
ncbi:hypothetical protein GmRootV77_00630 [Variovorax sp. V77]